MPGPGSIRLKPSASYSSRRNSGTDHIGALAAGLLLTGAFPSLGLDWISWFALVPLLFAVRYQSFKGGFRFGFLAGLVHYFTLLFWIIPFLTTFGGLPYYLAMPVHFLLSSCLGLYWGVFSCGLAWLRPGAWGCLLFAPAFWVSLEFGRGLLLSGFPWELLGYTQFKRLHLIQISDIFGVYGVSFLVVMVNVAVFFLLLAVLRVKWRDELITLKSGLALCLVALSALAASWYYGGRQIERMAGLNTPDTRITAAVIQGNIDQRIKWDAESQQDIIDKYVRLSKSSRAHHPNLVIWPETAAPFYFGYDIAFTKALRDAIIGINTNFLFGSPSIIPDDGAMKYYNSAYIIDAEGQELGRYDKVHLVPFGEYVPVWLPFVGKIVEEVGNFSTGKTGKTVPLNGEEVGIQICYEVIFPTLSRALVRNGATLLVNITNDAWYGKSAAPYQHFSMAVFRAVENKRSLIRSANTGISGFIDPTGRILSATDMFETAVSTHEVPRIQVKTLYARFGDWFAQSCLVISVLILCPAMIRKRIFRLGSRKEKNIR